MEELGCESPCLASEPQASTPSGCLLLLLVEGKETILDPLFVLVLHTSVWEETQRTDPSPTTPTPAAQEMVMWGLGPCYRHLCLSFLSYVRLSGAASVGARHIS